jgi:hypothetical protein
VRQERGKGERGKGEGGEGRKEKKRRRNGGVGIREGGRKGKEETEGEDKRRDKEKEKEGGVKEGKGGNCISDNGVEFSGPLVPHPGNGERYLISTPDTIRSIPVQSGNHNTR